MLSVRLASRARPVLYSGCAFSSVVLKESTEGEAMLTVRTLRITSLRVVRISVGKGGRRRGFPISFYTGQQVK
jgi:hypothetical protein